jgi:diamine N-acetyltransferase
MLRNASLRLRAIDTEDLDMLRAWRNDPACYSAFYEFDALSRAQQTAWWEQASARTHQEKNYIIARVQDNTPLGTISLLDIDWRSRNAEVGRMWVAPAYQRQGVARQALGLLLAYALGHLGLRKLWLEVLADNHAAVALYQQAGFVQELTLRAHVFKHGQFCDVWVMAYMTAYE